MSDRRETKAITSLLHALGKAALWIDAVSVVPSYCGPRTEIGMIRAREREERQRRQAEQSRIGYLKRKQWIKTKKTETGLMLALTKKGRLELMRRVGLQRPKLLSGQMCIIIWDIPESVRKGRDRLRYFLKEVGFTQLQKSVWGSPYDVVKELKLLIKDAKIEKWVKIIIGKIA